MSKAATSITALAVVLVLLVSGSAIAVVQAVFGSSPSGMNCTPTGTASGAPAGYSQEQMSNATTIVAAGKQMGIPEQGWIIAIAAAIQESGLRNLHHGDRDSLGLFQQRPSMGWGTPDQITTPSYAATKFFEHLQATPGWKHMSLTDAAQAVQGSGFPHAYAQHEPTARAIVAAVAGAHCAPGTGSCDDIQAPTAAAVIAINYACGQLGLPYVWGGNGPDGGHTGFDCSGLTKAAYNAAGITLPRTAHTQYHAGPRVPDDQPLLPGDLVFYGTPAKIHHVGLYLGNGKMINAPTFGQPVQIDNHRHPSDDYAGSTRPAN
ncbi:C40 family peptidase [Amycolatopsis lurida]